MASRLASTQAKGHGQSILVARWRKQDALAMALFASPGSKAGTAAQKERPIP